MAAFLKSKKIYLTALLLISANAIATPAKVAENDYKMAYKAYEHKIDSCANLEVENKASEKLLNTLKSIPKQHLSKLLPYYSFTAFHQCLQPEEAEYLVTRERAVLFDIEVGSQGAVSISKLYVELKDDVNRLPHYDVFENQYFQSPYKISQFFGLVD